MEQVIEEGIQDIKEFIDKLYSIIKDYLKISYSALYNYFMKFKKYTLKIINAIDDIFSKAGLKEAIKIKRKIQNDEYVGESEIVVTVITRFLLSYFLFVVGSAIAGAPTETQFMDSLFELIENGYTTNIGPIIQALTAFIAFMGAFLAGSTSLRMLNFHHSHQSKNIGEEMVSAYKKYGSYIDGNHLKDFNYLSEYIKDYFGIDDLSKVIIQAPDNSYDGIYRILSKDNQEKEIDGFVVHKVKNSYYVKHI